jgi:hypothetical protein
MLRHDKSTMLEQRKISLYLVYLAPIPMINEISGWERKLTLSTLPLKISHLKRFHRSPKSSHNTPTPSNVNPTTNQLPVDSMP